MSRVLITGGAGFIGSHLADELLVHGYEVRALDSLVDQVHGAERPGYLDAEVELVVGDVRDRGAVRRALQGVDAVAHLAARVGVGQSMYEIEAYTSANSAGTGVLLDALLDLRVGRLLVASSMSIYGEGRYLDEDGRIVDDAVRSREALDRGEWEPRAGLRPVPTPEAKTPSLTSVYALSKYDQERLCLMFGDAYDVPAVALRFFNAYGPRQALSNPYTGVLAIFAARLLNGKPPLVFEDGEQRRDFVSVHDIARACRLALESDDSAGLAINAGSGASVTISELALRLADVLEVDLEPQVTGSSRVGDIRHCFADTRLAEGVLGYQPLVELEVGLAELAEWLQGQDAVDRVDQATQELAARGLTR